MSFISDAMVIILFFVTFATVRSAPVPTQTLNADSTYFEGDIMLTDDQLAVNDIDGAPTKESSRAKRSLNAATMPPKNDFHHTWANGVVPYQWSATIDAKYRMMFSEAIEMIEEATCITFVHRSGQSNYLVLKGEANGPCRSNVGCTGGPQYVVLGGSCASVGTALHELGHALGLWHEHSRIDRDDYIEIFRENLQTDRVKDFNKVTPEIFKTVPDVGYDIESVMHYSPFAFAKNYSLPTIGIKEGADLAVLRCENHLRMGQRDQLSYRDKLRLNRLYQCTDINVMEPVCVTPTTTPMPTPTTSETTTEESTYASTVVPTPTATQPTARPLSTRLVSGKVLSLELVMEGNISRRGIECNPSPGCTPVVCTGNHCEQNIRNQFQLIKPDFRVNGKNVRSGSTIILRSIDVYSHFLDCSNPTRCVVSECKEDAQEDRLNASYASSCAKHQFQVFGVNRTLNKILNTKSHKLKFKSTSPRTDSKNRSYFLSCNAKRCHLQPEGACPKQNKNLVFNVTRLSPGLCPVDSFQATILAE